MANTFTVTAPLVSILQGSAIGGTARLSGLVIHNEGVSGYLEIVKCVMRRITSLPPWVDAPGRSSFYRITEVVGGTSYAFGRHSAAAAALPATVSALVLAEVTTTGAPLWRTLTHGMMNQNTYPLFGSWSLERHRVVGRGGAVTPIVLGQNEGVALVCGEAYSTVLLGMGMTVEDHTGATHSVAMETAENHIGGASMALWNGSSNSVRLRSLTLHQRSIVRYSSESNVYVDGWELVIGRGGPSSLFLGSNLPAAQYASHAGGSIPAGLVVIPWAPNSQYQSIGTEVYTATNRKMVTDNESPIQSPFFDTTFDMLNGHRMYSGDFVLLRKQQFAGPPTGYDSSSFALDLIMKHVPSPSRGMIDGSLVRPS